MDLLERYLQAVGQYLAAETRDDVLAELRGNLQAEMDAAAEGREGALTESEAAAILKAHGRPMLVAARYMPQRYLIGPEMFPFYLQTLHKTAPLVTLAYLVAHIADFLFSPNPGALSAVVLKSLLGFVPVLLISWSLVTLTFAILDYARKEQGAGGNEWDPAKLPALTKPKKGKSRGGRIIDLAVHCLWMVYVFAIPRHLYLVMGPGALFLTRLQAEFAPVWRMFYVAIVVLLVVQLVIKLMALSPGEHRWEQPLLLVTKVLGIVPTALLAYTTVYFVPAGQAANVNTLAQINHLMSAGFRIALLIATVSLVVDCWQYFRRFVPTQRLAF